MTRALAFSLLFVGTLATLARADEPRAADPAQLEFFEKNVRPILANRCFKCHGPEKHKGDLRLDSREGIAKGGESGVPIVPGKPDESELIKAVRYEADGFQMPPTGKLPDDEIAKLTEWVKMGAPWPAEKGADSPKKTANVFNLAERAQHWSFQPVKRPALPNVTRVDWPMTPVDRFVLAKLESKKLQPAEATDKRTLLRRVTFDLIGLPPTTAELDAFLSDDSPDAYERVVDRLLASPHYGERWGRHWLDLVRFAETYGHEFDYEIPNAWRYRDYVVRALNTDVPYDQFVKEHIAGDLLTEPRRTADGLNESVVGTGFYWFGQGKHSPVDIRAEECDTVDNQIDVLGKTFLGLTIACARCHDHKFDAITTKDYYALAGYLQSSRQQLAILNDGDGAQDKLRDLERSKALCEARLRWTLFAMIPPALKTSIIRGAVDFDPNRDSPLQQVLRLSTITDRQDFARRRSESLKAIQAQVEAAKAFQAHSIALSHFSKRVDAELAESKTLEERVRSLGTQGGGLGLRQIEDPGFGDWMSAGDAFGTSPTLNIDWLIGDLKQPFREFIPPGFAHSGLISGKLRGTLRSPTFTIDKPFIHYRVSRQGGLDNPGRAAKNGQIHLIVDGFQIIKDPLYGMLSLNIPQGPQMRWLRQDVSKFIGSRAYIEIEDDDDGHICVDKVLASTDPIPVDKPGPISISLLSDPAIQSADHLKQKRDELVTAAWHGPSIVSRSPVETTELLNNLVSSKTLLHAFQDFASHRSPIAPASALDTEPIPTGKNLLDEFELFRERASHIEPPQFAIAMIDGTSENEHILVRGNHKKPGDEVPRRFLEAFESSGPAPAATGSGRLQLAERIVDPANPLAARVIVNRLWHHHFGRGIVSTTDDFGHMGQTPSHPELLDYLATEFVRGGWSIKSMQRMMVLSNTYRMSSASNNVNAETRDPQNLLLHRMPLRRLEGEALRDAMLALSGRLDSRLEGPSVAPHLSEFMEGRGRPATSGPIDGNGRRSVYINVRRNFLTPFFLAFDYPTPLSTAGRRSVSNVPAQALSMMNNPFVVEQSRLWAQKAAAGTAADPSQRIRRLYAEAFSREPSADELTLAMKFLNEEGKGNEQAWADFCHALWNVKEFAYVR